MKTLLYVLFFSAAENESLVWGRGKAHSRSFKIRRRYVAVKGAGKRCFFFLSSFARRRNERTSAKPGRERGDDEEQNKTSGYSSGDKYSLSNSGEKAAGFTRERARTGAIQRGKRRKKGLLVLLVDRGVARASLTGAGVLLLPKKRGEFGCSPCFLVALLVRVRTGVDHSLLDVERARLGNVGRATLGWGENAFGEGGEGRRGRRGVARAVGSRRRRRRPWLFSSVGKFVSEGRDECGPRMGRLPRAGAVMKRFGRRFVVADPRR